MTDNLENLVLELLRSIRGDISAIRDDIREVKQSLTSLEIAVVGIRREIVHLSGDIAEQHSAHDRLAERVERIERRLELV